MRHSLAGGWAIVDTDVVARWMELGIKYKFGFVEQAQQAYAFRPGGFEK